MAFDGNGGQGTMPSITMENGTVFILPENGFVRPGYTFLGWWVNNDPIGPTYEPAGGPFLYANWEPGSTATLYAVWGKDETEPSTEPSTSYSTGGTVSSTSSSSDGGAANSDPNNSGKAESKGTGTSYDPVGTSKSTKQLPSTGETNSKGAIVIGVLAVLTVVGLWFKRMSHKVQ